MLTTTTDDSDRVFESLVRMSREDRGPATVVLANQKTFLAPLDSTLLDAARHAGVVLEHSCRTGRCGTCKARVVEGEAQALGSNVALNASEQAAGWILTCTSGALTDMRLDISDLDLPADVVTRTLPCRIDQMERLASDVMRLVLRLPPKSGLNYVPGQYIDLIGNNGLRRSYSIANAPAEDARLELHVRRLPGGAMSEYVFEKAKVNDLLRLHGPIGTFFLREVAGLDLVFLATGTGIAPIKAMLAALATRDECLRPRSVTLLWGGRRPEDLYWLPPSEDVTYVPVLSRAGEAWEGARGHVQHVFLARPAGDWRQTRVYACGSIEMIDSARAALTRAGLSTRHFFSDAFVSSS